MGLWGDIQAVIFIFRITCDNVERIISKGSLTATGGIPYKLNPAALLSNKMPQCRVVSQSHRMPVTRFREKCSQTLSGQYSLNHVMSVSTM